MFNLTAQKLVKRLTLQTWRKLEIDKLGERMGEARLKLNHTLLTLFFSSPSSRYSLLRLLLTFAGVLREKNYTRASFNKTPANYISEETLINSVYDKNTI